MNNLRNYANRADGVNRLLCDFAEQLKYTHIYLIMVLFPPKQTSNKYNDRMLENILFILPF